jgi:hypothetical protein
MGLLCALTVANVWALVLLANTAETSLTDSLPSLVGGGSATAGIALMRWVHKRAQAAKEFAEVARSHLELGAKSIAQLLSYAPKAMEFLDHIPKMTAALNGLTEKLESQKPGNSSAGSSAVSSNPQP